jgi:hypothetical protein
VSRNRRIAAAVILSLSACWTSAQEPALRPPSYLLLRAATAPTHSRSVRGFIPAAPFAVEASPYAYGWFGVQPRRHGSRHFGYYNNYTQWSAQ